MQLIAQTLAQLGGSPIQFLSTGLIVPQNPPASNIPHEVTVAIRLLVSQMTLLWSGVMVRS